jgi:hypothetical protein
MIDEGALHRPRFGVVRRGEPFAVTCSTKGMLVHVADHTPGSFTLFSKSPTGWSLGSASLKLYLAPAQTFLRLGFRHPDKLPSGEGAKMPAIIGSIARLSVDARKPPVVPNLKGLTIKESMT